MQINEDRSRNDIYVSALFTQVPLSGRLKKANIHEDSPEVSQKPVGDESVMDTTPLILLTNTPTTEDSKLALY